MLANSSQINDIVLGKGNDKFICIFLRLSGRKNVTERQLETCLCDSNVIRESRETKSKEIVHFLDPSLDIPALIS